MHVHVIIIRRMLASCTCCIRHAYMHVHVIVDMPVHVIMDLFLHACMYMSVNNTIPHVCTDGLTN